MDSNEVTRSSKRVILSQVSVTSVTSFQFFLVGVCYSFGTIQIASLSAKDADEPIVATENDLSWIGSIAFIFRAVGNIVGGPVTVFLGRKKAMLIGNVPTAIAWILMWQSTNIGTLLFANALSGLGVGITSAAVVSYHGEIAKPSLRGILACVITFFFAFGILGIFLLGSIIHWKTAAAVLLGVSLFGMITLFLVPESPMWLLSKGKNEDALASLCWARGWAKPEQVKREFDELVSHNKDSQKCHRCESLAPASSEYQDICTHRDVGVWQRFQYLMSDLNRREVRRPLILATLFPLFAAMTSFTSTQPTMVNLFKDFHVALDPEWTLAAVGVATIIGSLLCLVLIGITGKRKLTLACMAGSCIFTMLLGVYAQINVPPETSSFVEAANSEEGQSVLPLILFIIMVLFNASGPMQMPLIYISEIFPIRIRGFACGLAVSLTEVCNFIATKTYIDVESSMHIYGAFYFYGAFTIVGFIYLYLFLLETEGRTLAEIEGTFANKDIVVFSDDCIARKLNRSSSGDDIRSKTSFSDVDLRDADRNDSNTISSHTYVNEAFDYAKNTRSE